MENIFSTENKNALSKVYAYLSGALLISGIVSLIFIYFSNDIIIKIGASGFNSLVLISCVLELIVALVLGLRIFKMPATTVKILFFLYAILTGISLSSILLLYTFNSIVFAFFTTALVFICLAVIGKTTKVDLSKFANIFFIGLIVCIISSLLNIFIFKATILETILCYVEVILFLGITAYDFQRLKFLDNYNTENIYLYFAFEIYLDFINLFIRVVQMFGKRRND